MYYNLIQNILNISIYHIDYSINLIGVDIMILDKAREQYEYIVNLRRHFHMYPELSNEEFKTRERIIEELTSMGIEIKETKGTSIIGILKGGHGGKTIALRADMDALPIQEKLNLDYKSKVDGVMHACGHDAHSAMLLGAAKILSDMRDDLHGEVRFFFQQAEEMLNGAPYIIEAGGLDNVDVAYGCHNWTGLPVGKVGISPGYRMAGTDNISITLKGVSGHSSTPHLARDTILPAALLITSLQGIVTKEIAPKDLVVISPGRISGGTKANIISNNCEIEISIRYYKDAVRDQVLDAIERHTKSIADAYRIDSLVSIQKGCSSLFNNPQIVDKVKKSITKILGEDAIEDMPDNSSVGSEDFSYYANIVPAAYSLVGVGNPEKGLNKFPHHDEYDIDENGLIDGTALYVQFALDFLNNN